MIELCDEVFLSISYQGWGKVMLGSVHDEIFPSMSYQKWGRVGLSISYPRWGKVRLGSVQMVELVDLSNEGVVRGEFFLGRSVAYLI